MSQSGLPSMALPSITETVTPVVTAADCKSEREKDRQGEKSFRGDDAPL